MGRRGPRPTKAAAISRAALGLLAERGVRGATMRAIAQRAHTTEGNLYRYYPNKGELVGHVLGACLRDFGGHLAEALTGAPDPGAALTRFVRTYLEHARRLPLEGRAMFEAEGNGNGTSEPARPLPRRVLVRLLSQGMETGAFASGNPERLASFILGGLTEASSRLQACPDAGRAEADEEIVQAVRRLAGVVA